MNSVLKPYTIIPPDLYIQRDADRQLQNIINDLGRPGYVLVSRQMGKTNLLLNAKRKLEGPDDVFVYVDLSNPFDTAKQCFENIVDIAIETNSDKFHDIEKIIKERRTEYRETPAHKQHTNELRLLARTISGKLVIILDEIDALTKTQYSDQIFAQIRSVYFSRVNFPELGKVTYILSGVMEPSEIIKDPKISPFNIGQKIFLNDFNREEFDRFIINSKIKLSSELVDRIFSWTNGNPRMTWDVCAEIENKSLSEILTVNAIDKIVSQVYLTLFDKPPIDNIRELVKKDREIRNAIVEIEYKKGKEISDKIKSKLYLSGIINYDESEIVIKNEIIRQSLNLDWIRTLEEEDRGLLGLASEFFEKENYADALAMFEKYAAENDFEDTDKALYYYYMGNAAYRLSQFEKASIYLEQANFDPEDGKLYYRVQHLKAIVFYYRGLINDSLKCLKEIINSDRKDDTYARALLNFGSFSIASSEVKHKNSAKNIFEGIINETAFKKGKLKDSLVNELKAIAYYNLAQIYFSNSDQDSARLNLKLALGIAEDKIKPSIILALLNELNDQEEKLSLIKELVELITTGKIKPAKADPERKIDFSFSQFREIVVATLEIQNKELLSQLIPHFQLLGDKSLAEHFYELAIFALNENKNTDAAIQILMLIRGERENADYSVSNEIYYQTVKLLAYFVKGDGSLSNELEYAELFDKKKPKTVDILDIEIFSNIIYLMNSKKKHTDAIKYIKIINGVRSHIPQEIFINYLLILHLELNTYYAINDREKAVSKAHEVIKLASDPNIKGQTSNLLGETGLDMVKKNAELILNPKSSNHLPIKVGRTFGRNEIVKVRYNDGSIIEAKFKKVEYDLNNSNCFILQ